MSWEEQVALDIKHSKDPKAGDYWEDHFCPVLIVVGVMHGIVVFFDKTVDVDSEHWKFDESKPNSLALPEFTKKLRYNSPNMGEQTWANVHPAK